MTTKENLTKAPEGRVRRSPLDRKNVLNVKGTRPDYAYRIVNDTGDRINDLIEQGWEIDLSEDIRVGDSRIEQSSKLGKVRMVPVGQGVNAVVMRKRKDWYDEDEQIKQDYVKSTEAAMRPDSDGGYGKVEITRK
jgi:hypothetical protein